MTTQTMLARAIADADPDLVCAARELVAVLEAIVNEVDGPADCKPYSADSYLPPHFVTMARAAVARAKGGAA
jgi:hypothetical protein